MGRIMFLARKISIEQVSVEIISDLGGVVIAGAFSFIF
jgi:hypothetical protein